MTEGNFFNFINPSKCLLSELKFSLSINFSSHDYNKVLGWQTAGIYMFNYFV